MRKPMITRTIESTAVTAMCVDTETAEVCNRVFHINSNPKDDDAALKAVKKQFETETLKLVQVVATGKVCKTYAMPLDDFIVLATEVPAPEAE